MEMEMTHSSGKQIKKFADLLEDICRLSNELKGKDALLMRYIDLAHEQSQWLT